MLRKEKPIVLKSSASALCNNLNLVVSLDKGLIYYVVVHKSLANFVTATIDGSNVNHRQIICKQHNDSSSMMLQAKIVQFSNQVLLVTTSQRTIQIFDAATCNLIHSHSLVDDLSKEGDTYGIFGRGISGVLDNYICVGTHDGQIVIFDVPPRGNITIFGTLSAHDSAICDLKWEGMLMASSDDNGNICLWKVGGDFQKQIRIRGDGISCSCVALWKDLVIGGYATGHIRMFDVKTGDIRIEIAAHARYITALDVAWKAGLLLSASEDSFVRLWELTTGDTPMVEHLCGESVTNTQLQGANFLTPAGRAFAVTGYDSSRIEFFTVA